MDPAGFLYLTLTHRQGRIPALAFYFVFVFYKVSRGAYTGGLFDGAIADMNCDAALDTIGV